ncbi:MULTISPECIES: sugar kinase [Arthrobacter]|uniref:Sugar kinase n=2 Tax=Arthrobacter TaxID=1663 RepID=A0ABU9KG48_9MICC|nr:sugar kinase [Arthrobacter sp. YJM1]MDP5225788.1 sugar kinase [Arthrobacter sp. YJM1]
MPRAICLGETMAMLTPGGRGSLETADSLHLGVGGAESNVALGLAAMGVSTEWVSRLGADGFGRRIRNELERHRVGTRGVQLDEARPTGLYVKVPGDADSGTGMLYYRSGSAASAMSPALLDDPEVAAVVADAGLIHLSGITAALSDSCRDLLLELLSRPRRSGQRISFDVNWRPALWKGRDSSVLQRLADLSDIVLMGKDEALLAFGTDDEGRLRELLPTPEVLIIKNESTSAIALERDGARQEVPALSVDVVEPVGAGDSFAAGYLSGVLSGLDQRLSLRRGHVAAACTLTVHGDRGPLPDDEDLDHILRCSDEEWASLRVTQGRFLVGQA